MRAGDRLILSAKLSAKPMRLYVSVGVDAFVHDDMQPALHAAWNDHYSAKSLYMAEGRLTSVEGRWFQLSTGSITEAAARCEEDHRGTFKEGCCRLVDPTSQ